ncbi:MAG: hypothetical protein KatS3mg040_0435 [Candidatus Kapaibacterium sp.]|nr:MAG: hypothetical protein KatS3mg040_0435 [Candidatus Kapabacteria bacterium]
MRPSVALLDESLGARLNAFLRPLPPSWQRWIVTPSSSDIGAHAVPRLSATTKSQSCICQEEACIRDAVLAAVPDRAFIAAVIVQPALACLCLCADAVFVPSNLVAWCRTHGIPTTHARTLPELALLWERFLRAAQWRTRYQAHRYRHHCLEIE